MNQTAINAAAFAELVRKMSLNILRANNAGRYDESTDLTLSLLEQACNRLKELEVELATPEVDDPARYDLRTLFNGSDQPPAPDADEL